MADHDTASRRGFLAAAGITAITAGMANIAAAAEPLAPPDKQPPHLPVPDAPPKKIGFAIVGLGELALEEILPAFALSENAMPVALVSGHRDKAEKIAALYGISRGSIYNYENYDTIKDNPQVQAIYIVLPNSMHAEYTVRGFAAGKHVLCEKPMAVTPGECQQMIDAGKRAQKKLMIAYRLHFEPYNKLMIEMARNKELGQIRIITAENLQNTTAPNIRLSKSTGGGPLGDVGIYCLNAARYITGEEPVEVTGHSFADPGDERFREVPSQVLFTLRFPSGVLAQCSCGFDSYRSDRYRVICDKGYMELDPAFGYEGQRMKVVRKGSADSFKTIAAANVSEAETSLVVKHANHFAAEMDHFAQCIMNGVDPLTPGEEGLKDMRIIAAINESIAAKQAVQI